MRVRKFMPNRSRRDCTQPATDCGSSRRPPAGAACSTPSREGWCRGAPRNHSHRRTAAASRSCRSCSAPLGAWTSCCCPSTQRRAAPRASRTSPSPSASTPSARCPSWTARPSKARYSRDIAEIWPSWTARPSKARSPEITRDYSRSPELDGSTFQGAAPPEREGGALQRCGREESRL